MLSNDLSPKEQMKRARIQLYRNMPFFGYLVQYLDLIETDQVPTAGITEDTRVFYNPEFIDSLTEEETKGVLAHEVMHKAMDGFKRQGNRDDQKWNVAQDLVINHILVNENGMALPDKGLIPDSNGTFESEDGSLTVENIHEKNFEQVYDNVPKQDAPEGGFDIHIKIDGDGEGEVMEGGAGGGDGDIKVTIEQAGDGEGGGDGDQEVEGGGGESGEDIDDIDWDSVVAQAQQHAASQGSEPGGIEDLLEVNREGDVDYKRLISQTISSHVPSDYTVMSPSKRSRAVGEYLPSVKTDEGLEVITVLDTSGSVGDALLERFIGEIKHLVDTFENVDLTVIQHDADVQSVEEYERARTNQFDEFEIKGRGGTSHVPVFEEVEEEHMDGTGPTIMICLTDGYTTVPDKIPAIDDLIWVLNNHAVQMDRLKHGQIVRIEPEEE